MSHDSSVSESCPACRELSRLSHFKAPAAHAPALHELVAGQCRCGAAREAFAELVAERSRH